MKHKPVIIKDMAWIGFNVIILKGVTICISAVVVAGSVVAKDLSDCTMLRLIRPANDTKI
jgi:galactoside O-acetyltransferase